MFDLKTGTVIYCNHEHKNRPSPIGVSDTGLHGYTVYSVSLNYMYLHYMYIHIIYIYIYLSLSLSVYLSIFISFYLFIHDAILGTLAATIECGVREGGRATARALLMAAASKKAGCALVCPIEAEATLMADEFHHQATCEQHQLHAKVAVLPLLKQEDNKARAATILQEGWQILGTVRKNLLKALFNPCHSTSSPEEVGDPQRWAVAQQRELDELKRAKVKEERRLKEERRSRSKKPDKTQKGAL